MKKYHLLAFLGLSVFALEAQAQPPAKNLTPCWKESWKDAHFMECGSSVLINGLEREIRWSNSGNCGASGAASLPKNVKITDQKNFSKKPFCQIK